MTPGPRLSRLWWFTGPMLLLLVAGAAVLGTVKVPYVVLSPGGARAVGPLIDVSEVAGGPEVDLDDPTEDLLYVTVRSAVEPSGIYALYGWLDDTIQVEPSAPILGTQSPDENRSLNLALMTDSQEKAQKVALERLGYDVVSTPEGAFLEDVDPDFPSSEVLKPGMTVVAAGGEPVEDRDDLVEAITALSPGDPLPLEVIALGETEAVEVTATLGERPGSPGEPVLGVTPVSRASYEFPVDVDIDTGEVGGPSAGLAFTLAIIDRLTPGSLTGDSAVAVTGTIELDGTVGPVGGVRHKTEAAVREGATVFLVPSDEFELAEETAGDRLKVVAVADLDEALEALEDLGGSSIPGAED